MRGVLPPDVIGLTISPSTEPFWKAAAEHRLVIPQCTTCGTFRLPPSPFCHHCRAQEVDWVEHDSAGELYSFTVIRHAVVPTVADVRIGLPVTLDWYDVRPGEAVPVFRLD